MVKLLFDFRVDKKQLYLLSRAAFAVSLIVFGLMALSEVISKKDDMKAYYNIWQAIAPRTYEGRVPEERMEKFY